MHAMRALHTLHELGTNFDFCGVGFLGHLLRSSVSTRCDRNLFACTMWDKAKPMRTSL